MISNLLKQLSLFALAVALVLGSAGLALGEDERQPPSSGVRVSHEFDSLHVSNVSRWKYEMRNWPNSVMCVGFWRRLNADVTDNPLTIQQLNNVDETAKMAAQADPSLLRRLSDWLSARPVGYSSNLLIDFVDECAYRLEKDGAHSKVVDAPETPAAVPATPSAALPKPTPDISVSSNVQPEPPKVAPTITQTPVGPSKQSEEEITKLRSELAKAQEQLKAEQTTVKQLRFELERANDISQRLQTSLDANKSELGNCRDDLKSANGRAKLIGHLTEVSEELTGALKETRTELESHRLNAENCQKKLEVSEMLKRDLINQKVDLERRISAKQPRVIPVEVGSWQSNNYADSYSSSYSRFY